MPKAIDVSVETLNIAGDSVFIEFTCYDKNENTVPTLAGVLTPQILTSRPGWRIAINSLINQIQHRCIILIQSYDEFADAGIIVHQVILRNPKKGARGTRLIIHYTREGDLLPAKISFIRRPDDIAEIVRFRGQIAEGANDQIQFFLGLAHAVAVLVNKERPGWDKNKGKGENNGI